MGNALPLREIVSTAAKGRGALSVAVIERPGAEAHACWVPESDTEPAFLVYSITKTFIAALTLGLCERGQLGLDDRLATWFPRIAHADRISLRQLLNHSAGMPEYGHMPSYSAGVKASPHAPWSFERFAAETFDKGLLFEPGQGWAYSNPGYMLLKRIVEQAGGDSLRVLVADRIVRPLGLCRTEVAESVEDLAALAPSFSRALSPDGAPRDVRANYHPGWVSHGAVVSTASDIARFFDALFRGELVSPDSLAQMMEFVAVPDDEAVASTRDDAPRWGKPSYGLGLMGDPDSRWGLIAGHNGGGPGYSASAFHAFDLNGATVCAIGAIENEFRAEDVVFDVLTHL